jgi:hypothetical protein
MAYDLPSPEGWAMGTEIAAPTTPAPDGRFSLSGAFGPMVFRLAGLPAGWALRAVWLDDQDVTDRAADLRPSDRPRRLRMLVTNRTARLTGTVARSDRGPLSADTRVVVFAADEGQWATPSRFVAVARVEPTGDFSLDGLLPAAYLVSVADDLDDDSWQDSTVLRQLMGTAMAVTLAAGDNRTVALTTGGAR